MSTSDPLSHLGRPLEQADLVRWGPVVSGVVVGLGMFALVDALWLGLAQGADGTWPDDALRWLIGGTAAAALLLAGFTAGLLAGVRGTGAGLAHGLTAWGLLLLLSLLEGVPGALDLTGSLAAPLREEATIEELGSAGDSAPTGRSALVSSFWALLIGLVLAVSGGVMGGRLRRPSPAPRDQAAPGPTPMAAPQGSPPAADRSPGTVDGDDGAGRPALKVHHLPPSREDGRSW